MRYTLRLLVGALLASTSYAQTPAPQEPAGQPEAAASAAASVPDQPTAPAYIPKQPDAPVASAQVPVEAIQAPAPAPASPPAPEHAATAPASDKVEEIVVTGSRIKRKELTTPAPVTVLTKDTITASGKINVGDFLQVLPEQGGGVNAQINNGNDGSVTVNLRSLGDQRTLVLVNGRRMVAGGKSPGATPDLNSIPTVAIERIEVLKDGASAIYGSDAIGGVVNIITKKRFNGSEASVYAGQTGYGDGTTWDVSGSVGTGNETSSVLFSVAYQNQAKVLASARPWSNNPPTYDFQSGKATAIGNSTTFPDGRVSLPAPGATCANSALRASKPALDAVCKLYGETGVNDFVPGGYGPDGSSLYSTYDFSLYNTYPTNYLSIPNHRLQMFATGYSQLGSEARAFFEASYVNRYSQNNMAPMPVTSNSAKSIVISKDSMYNPFGVDITSWRRRTVEFGNRTWSDLLDTFRVVTGVDGELGSWAGPLKGWIWEAAFNYGRTGGTEVNQGQLRMDTFGNATGPSMLDSSGNPICVKVAGDASTKIPGCIPSDVLHGQGTLLPSMADYIGSTGVLKAVNDQKVLTLNLGGDLFKLFARRPVGLAVGYDFRSEFAEQIPDPITAAGQTTGNMQKPTSGTLNVNEGFLELSVPVVSNRFLADNLELSLAARVVKFEQFKANQSYKVGALYSPFRDISLRGTFSTAFRAPNINELFGGSGMSADFVQAGDPCRGASRPASCAADSKDPSVQFDTLKGSNPNLTPETAKIFTAGVVVGPRAVPNLSITLDYYNVKLDNTIGYLGAAYIIAQCYEGGDPTMCERITRDSTYKIVNVDDQRRNYGTATASGIDLAARYRFPIETYGRFGFTFDGTYLIESNSTDATGFVTKSAGNYDSFILTPRVKFNAGVSWGMGGFGASVISRYIGSFKECGSGSCSIDDSDQRVISAFAYFDGNVNYSFKSSAGRTTLMMGVQNIFNADPPFITNANNYGTDPDFPALGRYFYARVTQSL